MAGYILVAPKVLGEEWGGGRSTSIPSFSTPHHAAREAAFL